MSTTQHTIEVDQTERRETNKTNKYADEPAKADKMPSTAKMEQALSVTEHEINKARENAPSQVDEKGQELMADAATLAADLRKFLHEKNSDDLIQRIIAQTELAGKDAKDEAVTMKNENKPDEQTKRDVKQQTRNIAVALRTMASEVWSSASFRQDIGEILYVISSFIGGWSGVDMSNITEPLGKIGSGEGGSKITDQIHEVSVGVRETAEQARDSKGEREMRKMSEKEENELIDRLRKAMANISQHPQSRDFLRGFMDMIDLMGNQYRVGDKASATGEKVMDNEHLNQLNVLIRELCERFCGADCVAEWNYNFRKLVRIAKKDDQVGEYFLRARDFIMKNMENPDRWETRDEKVDKEMKYLITEGQALTERQDLRQYFTGLAKATRSAIRNFTNDSGVAAIQRDLAKLFGDIALNENGNVAFNPQVLKQLRFIVASVIERMVIEIPGFHQDNDKMEVTVNHITITLRDVMPDRIKFEYGGALDFDSFDLKDVDAADKFNMKLSLDHIHYHVADVDFSFKRKTFPKVKDSGALDIDLGGEGMRMVIALSTSIRNGPEGLYEVQKVDCNIDKLNIKLHDTKHDMLYNAVLKTQRKTIKARIQTAIEDKITKMLIQLNQFVVEHARQLQQRRRNADGTEMKDRAQNVASKIAHTVTDQVASRVAPLLGQQTDEEKLEREKRKLKEQEEESRSSHESKHHTKKEHSEERHSKEHEEESRSSHESKTHTKKEHSEERHSSESSSEHKQAHKEQVVAAKPTLLDEQSDRLAMSPDRRERAAGKIEEHLQVHPESQERSKDMALDTRTPSGQTQAPLESRETSSSSSAKKETLISENLQAKQAKQENRANIETNLNQHLEQKLDKEVNKQNAKDLINAHLEQKIQTHDDKLQHRENAGEVISKNLEQKASDFEYLNHQISSDSKSAQTHGQEHQVIHSDYHAPNLHLTPVGTGDRWHLEKQLTEEQTPAPSTHQQ